MDIVLRTNTEDPSLVFRNVQRFANGSGTCASIAVRSRGWAGEQLVCFAPGQLEEFAHEVEAMDRSLRGSAHLRSGHEDHWLELAVGSTGAVWVSGELFEYAEQEQRLQFGFRTDQTCLGPLASDLRACLKMAAT
jgi:hypothetical protein